MKVAIQGCLHGELDKVYSTIDFIQTSRNIKIDLLIICGDFQSVRNERDLREMACPAKFRKLGEFYEYYTGQKKAPCPTLFIGGNHEASNYLWELYHGGFVCPNIYFMGHAGVIKFGGLRIGGMSGIFKKHHYQTGYFETQPYNDKDCRSIYHVREYCVLKLAQVREISCRLIIWM